MGANQSSDGPAGGGGGAGSSAQQRRDGSEMKTCYYELLGVDRKATDEEIKKAYRKKALELHPDRNYGNVENTTKLFAEVQSAYEVLSDPQERAWYDSHRDAILRDDTEGAAEHYEHNVRVTTAEDIMRMFTKFNARMDFSDSSTGFYSVLGGTFETLAREEEMACEWEGLDPVDYPSFGNSKDSYEEVVRPFYAAWNGFTTRKTFSWKDVYRYSDAPDRRVRRMMEKENKRHRDEGIRELNDAVRSLVAFVRKRDPRYFPNSQTDAERQKLLRDAAAAQAARSRAANQAKLEEHVEADWSKSRVPEDYGEDESDEDIEEEQFECVACGKTFKSEGQFEAHEKSKKHLKVVQQLRREMQKENAELGLDDVTSSGLDTPNDVFEEVDAEDQNPSTVIDEEGPQEIDGTETSPINGPDDETNQMTEDISNNLNALASHRVKQPSPLGTPQNEGSSGDEYAPRAKVESRFADPIGQLTDAMASASVASDSSSTPRKMGKAKEKRARKAAQQKAVTESSELKCAACSEIFPSKTKLFVHIKEEGHAQPVPRTVKGGGKAKKK